MKVLTIALALLGVAACQQSSAASREPGWYEIAHTPGIVAYLDTARIDRLGDGHARIWFRFRYLVPYVASNDTSVKYEAAETRQELDCIQRRTRGLELRMQAAGGIAAAVPTPDAGWSSIDTHPLNSGVFLVACRTIGHPIPVRGGA
jgi:hypothetical protein